MALDIRRDDLTEEQQQLADLIGIESLCKLIETYGGTTIYVPKPDSFTRSERDERIREDFNGVNIKYLALKYSLSERTIRNILYDDIQEMKDAPLEGQVSMFD